MDVAEQKKTKRNGNLLKQLMIGKKKPQRNRNTSNWVATTEFCKIISVSYTHLTLPTKRIV